MVVASFDGVRSFVEDAVRRPEVSGQAGRVTAAGAWEVLHAPVGERIDGVSQRPAFVGQVVFDAQWVLTVRDAADEALALQTFESVGQDVRGDVFGRGQEVAVAELAEKQVADEQQGPAIADDVEGRGDGAT